MKALPAACAAMKPVGQVRRLDQLRRVGGVAAGQDLDSARAVSAAAALAQVVQEAQAVPVVAAADWATGAQDRLPQHPRAHSLLGMLPDAVRGAAAGRGEGDPTDAAHHLVIAAARARRGTS